MTWHHCPRCGRDLYPATACPSDDGDELPLDPPPITGAQMKMLHALLNENDLADRDAGLAYIGSVLGRDIASSKELSKPEATAVIDALKALGE